MSVTVELSPEVVRHLEAEAARRGTSIDEVIAELASALPAGTGGPRRNPGFVGVGNSGQGVSHRIDDLLGDGYGREISRAPERDTSRGSAN
jgi:hypothetical protein